jgi:hypothetical protein
MVRMRDLCAQLQIHSAYARPAGSVRSLFWLFETAYRSLINTKDIQLNLQVSYEHNRDLAEPTGLE